MSAQSDKKLIKRLAMLTIAAGDSGPAELKAALAKLLSGRPAADRNHFLAALQKTIQREWQRRTLTIESAAVLDEEMVEQIRQQFTTEGEPPVEVIRNVREELIAGLRVRMGDTVYDASVLGNLNALAARIH
jgi:F-type H+-transporting ATPase subunit delta